jgi:hypothetical protein
MAPPQKIRQWQTDQDGLDKLRIGETECPKPGENEVLVEVHAVSLNFRDQEGTCVLREWTVHVVNMADSIHSGVGAV